jgi:hypothetical protein
MVSNYLHFLTLTMLMQVLACAPTPSTPSTFKGDQIHFGQGGGFSGLLNYFVLLEDGRLFQRAFRDSTMSQVDNWNKNFVSQMFSNYKTLQLDQQDHYEPGDLYYFIEYRSRDKPNHLISWGRPGFRPDENIVTYYNLLYKSTKIKS